MVEFEELRKRVMNEKSLTEQQVNDAVQEEIVKRDGNLTRIGALMIIASKSKISVRSQAKLKKIKELNKEDRFVKIIGTIVNSYPLKFYGEGEKKGYVLNLHLDDGTENIRCSLFTNQVQNLLKKKHNEIMVWEGDDKKLEEIGTELLGQIVLLRGRVEYNEQYDRTDFVANIVVTDQKDEEWSALPEPKEEVKEEKIEPTEPEEEVEVEEISIGEQKVGEEESDKTDG